MTANKIVGSNKIVSADKIVSFRQGLYHSHGLLSKIVYDACSFPDGQ